MVKKLLAALLCTILVTSCSKPPVPTTPGQLQIFFNGIWGTQPIMEVQKEAYPFLVRLHGYVPPAAFMLVVSNQYGHIVAKSNIMYQDAMQTNPVRHYQFTQVVNQKTCSWLKEQVLDTQLDNLDDSRLQDVPADTTTGYPVKFTAEVITQTSQVLVSASYTVIIHCKSLGI